MKAGYKQTEVGEIPEDWDVRPLSACGAWFSGGTPKMGNNEYWNGDIPWASPKDMKVIRLSDAIDHITPKAVADGARLMPIGSLLVVVRGMILAHSFPVARVERQLAFNQDMKALVVCDDLDSLFLLYWFLSKAQHLRGLTTESTHGTKRLPTETLFRELVAYPAKAEQEAIAEALGDADALIESLERLLAKKRQLKQGAMQDLLTGKRRLPGFEEKPGYKRTEAGTIPEDWDAKRCREAGSILAGKALNVNGAGESRPYLRTKNVFDGRIDLGDVLRMPFTDTEFERYRLRFGDVLLNEGQSLDLVGRCSMYRDELDGPCAIQNQLVRFRANRDVCSDFAEHLFRRCQQSGVFAEIATQTTSVAHLGVGRFADLYLAWPSQKAEQEAIASVLSDMDAEADALEDKLATARKLKQGMMQELLSGRIRLV